MSLKSNVKYGWCYTDYKSGKASDSSSHKKSYVHSEKYGEVIQNILEDFNLPIPKDEEIYRGSSQDLLFLDDCGLVIRIGGHDVNDLMSSTILQPIGWKTTDIDMDRQPLTVAIYPGIKLIKDCYDCQDRELVEGITAEVSHSLAVSGHKNREVKPLNIGLVEIFNKKAEKHNAPILLDMDKYFNGSASWLASKRADIMIDAAKSTRDNAKIMSAVVNGLAVKNTEPYYNCLRVFEKHQPLREMFWSAANEDGSFNKCELAKFWDECAEIKENPQEMSCSVWELDQGGLVQTEAKTVNVDLYSPWVSIKAVEPAHNIKPAVMK